jgi:hypothetical protein
MTEGNPGAGPVTAEGRIEPGSFRDRNGRVFYAKGAVLRGLGEQATQEWRALSETSFFPRLVAAGKIVRTEQMTSAELVGVRASDSWTAVLRHETIPFVSYPYEWSFGMLRDAALLQLELLLAALDEGMILKDSSPFNVQWRGADPVFIDIPSFVRLGPGEPWVGYRQFCQLFLNPLLLRAYRNVPFQPWLRGSIDGIEPQHCKNLMTAFDRLRPGVLAHVVLHAYAQAGAARTRDVKGNLRAAGFHPALIRANVMRLRKLIAGLSWKDRDSVWLDYAERNTYGEAERAAKTAFVRQAVNGAPRRLVWDLGCNTGAYARLAAEHADYVVATDVDEAAVEHLYQELKTAGSRSILPLVMNLADPSPALGWRGEERMALTQRGRPDLTLCLALVHHVAIGANVPLDEFVEWFAGLGGELVIEFVEKRDPMVQVLLRNKEDIYDDYEIGVFERCLTARLEIVRRQTLGSGTRTLYHARPRS